LAQRSWNGKGAPSAEPSGTDRPARASEVGAAAGRDGAVDFLAGLLDATPDALIVKDERLRWVLVNDALCRMLGRPRERLLGATDFDLSPAAEAAHFNARDRVVLATGAVDVCEEDHTCPAGQRRRLLTRKSRLRLADGRDFVVCLFTDVSELARYRAELEARNRAAERLLERSAGQLGAA
jgi:two-component system NtrC family sensor kinase